MTGRGRCRTVERGAGLRSDDPVPAEPRPFLEGDDGEPRLLALHAVDPLGCHEPQIGQPLLQRASVVARGSARIGHRSGRRHRGPSDTARVTGLDSAWPGKSPSGTPPATSTRTEVTPGHRGHCVHELCDPRVELLGVAAGREGLAQVDGGDAVCQGDRAERCTCRDVRANLPAELGRPSGRPGARSPLRGSSCRCASGRRAARPAESRPAPKPQRARTCLAAAGREGQQHRDCRQHPREAHRRSLAA